MSYSHADANLMAVLALQQKTAQLLHALADTNPERARQLCEEADETNRDPQ
jgi:hypothetical protein